MQMKSFGTVLLITLCGIKSLVATESVKPSALVECQEALCARSAAVNSVVARLRVTLHDRIKNKDFELNGAYLGDAAGNLRLRVTTESGQLVLDMGMRGEKVDICIPGKSLYLNGTREELLDHPRCQLTLLAYCGRARDLFFPSVPYQTNVSRRSCSVNGRAYCNDIESTSLQPRFLTRLTLNLTSAVIEQKDIYARSGADGGRVVYSNYRFPVASAAAGKPAYPGRVTLHVPRDAFVLEMDVEDLSLNTPIAATKFAIPVPDGFKHEALTAALERNQSLWEQ